MLLIFLMLSQVAFGTTRRATRCLSTRWIDAAGHSTRWSPPLCVDTSGEQGSAQREED